MNSKGFLMITMNSKESLWILNNYCKFQRVPKDYNEFCKNIMNSLELIWIHKDPTGLQWILNDYYEFFRIIKNSYGFVWFTINFKQ